MWKTRAVRDWQHMLTNQGFAATLRVVVARSFQRLTARGKPATTSYQPAPPAIHPFDLQYGVDTSGLIWGQQLTSGSRNDRWNTAYYGIPPSIFHAVMAHLAENIPGAAFVDMGSGKGRAVMLATQFPFAEIYGVELSPALHETAVLNIEKFCPAGDPRVHLLCMDAAEFEFPFQPLVLFLYHPFCKPVLKRVLRRLEQSLRNMPRPVHLVYINVELRNVLNRTAFLTKVFEQTLLMSEEDQLADRIGSTVEECAIYSGIIQRPKIRVVN